MILRLFSIVCISIFVAVLGLGYYTFCFLTHENHQSIVERALDQSQDVITKSRLWCYVSYTYSVRKRSPVWNLLKKSLYDRKEKQMFHDYLIKEYHTNSEFIDEMIYTASIERIGSDAWLSFNKPASRLTKHLEGTTLSLLIPKSYSSTDVSLMTMTIERIQADSPLIEINRELGHWGSELEGRLKWYHPSQLTERIVKPLLVELGATGSATAGAAVGAALCGPACAVVGGFAGYIAGNPVFDKFVDWALSFWRQSPEEKLWEAYDFFNLNRDATSAEIKRTWRRVGSKLHPDNGGDHYKFAEAAIKMGLIKNHRYDMEVKVKKGAQESPEEVKKKFTERLRDAFDAVMEIIEHGEGWRDMLGV